MNFSEIIQNDTFVTSVVFNDEAVEVTYLENRDQTEHVMEAHVLVFAINDPAKVDILAMVQELLRDVIDRVVSERRNGPQPDVSARQQIRQRMMERTAADGTVQGESGEGGY